MKLKYIGNDFLVDVPARDLTEEEILLYGGQEYLENTGLYKAVNEDIETKPVEKDGI